MNLAIKALVLFIIGVLISMLFRARVFVHLGLGDVMILLGVVCFLVWCLVKNGSRR